MAEWVFGYGSLIWNPEIDYEHAELGRLHGFHRAFCIGSARYRGTPDNPGVVLGLDRGGSCIGMAFRLRPQTKVAAIAQLYAREMAPIIPLSSHGHVPVRGVARESVYVPTRVRITLASGARAQALTFVANRECSAYKRLSEQEVLRRLCGCAGQRGPNHEYLLNTLSSLEARGVRDAMLARLAQRLRAARAWAQGPSRTHSRSQPEGAAPAPAPA